MSELTSGDSDICTQIDNAMRSIFSIAYYGRKNPAYGIERLGGIIALAEYEIKLLKEIKNDKA